MSYSIIGILSLILNLILNHEAFRHFKFRSGDPESQQQTVIRYSQFLTVANIYFTMDIAWGLLYEFHEIDSIYPALYVDCLLYFLLMFATMLSWMRYIVAYLGIKGSGCRLFLGVVWAFFLLGLVYLLINQFHPFIFSFNEKHEYVPEPGRHIAFILQISLYLATTVYMFYVAHKSTRRDKVRYIAVGFTCFVMVLFLMMQILNPMYPTYAIGLIIGICVIHSFVEAGERKEKEIYDHIATSLAEAYEVIYYIDIKTGEYREFSASQKYDAMRSPEEGRNFFDDAKVNVAKYVHPDDRDFAQTLYQKETLLKNLEERKTISYKYRMMIEDQPRHYQFTMLSAHDGKHFVLYGKDIDDEITEKNIRIENQRRHVSFTQIAEILAINYDVIYYIDAEDSSYISYECRNNYGQLEIQKAGEDFFADCQNDISKIVEKNDRDLVLAFISRDHIISTLTNQKSCSIDYRIVAFDQTHYVRMTVQKTANETHYIIGIENIDDEIKKEKQHLKALTVERELARRDELTGIKNKIAYTELEKSVQANITNGMDYLPFGLVVCDSNNLKRVNDTEGHVAGDEYLKKSAKLLCDVFVHSPVFRVGGDEFVVFLRGDDYLNREKLMKSLRSQVQGNLKSGKGPILASGMAEYTPESDCLVSEIFDRADKEMYKNKQKLKKDEKIPAK